MEDHSSRRGFLRSIVRESARSAQEAGRLLTTKPPQPSGPSAPSTRRGPVLERARAASATVTEEELLELATELGLGERLDDVRALARHSVRLTSPTLDDHPAGAWLFEPAAGLLDEADWPLWEGERLTLAAQLDLGDPTLRDVDLPLPRDGRLVFLYPAIQAPAGDLAAHAGAARVLHVPAPFGPAPTARLSVELTLPRVWSAPVQQIGLDAIEHDGWLRLRRRLATLQDVELDDDLSATIAWHRALGYPNETSGDMPALCEEVRPGDGERWRLLLQLTVADDGAWNLGGEPGRLYFWIPESDLSAGDFARVHAIARPLAD